MCWLCHGETDALRYDYTLDPGPILFREITLEQGRTGQEGRAEISPIIREPKHALSVSASKKQRSLDLVGGIESVDYLNCTELTTPRCPVYDPIARTWTFRVHADCWELVVGRAPDSVACATVFCQSVLSTDWCFDTSCPIPRVHERTRKPACRGTKCRRVSMRQLESFDGLEAELGLDRLPKADNPMSLEQLGVQTWNLTSPTNTAAATTITTRNGLTKTTAGDPFFALPSEMLQLIIQHTPTSDLPSLRLASKAVAEVSHVADLPQAFWRSRFNPGFEMGFAMPRRSDADIDWRGMYFLIKRALARHCVVVPRMERPLMARLAKRRYWWERLGRVAEKEGISWDAD
ncbi:hypothetical protein VTH82DRAFT_8677 [Thermothelomyces myriococcoides]